MTLTCERLRALMQYDPATGDFTRIIAHTNSVKAGAIAGCHNGNGYIRVHVDGRQYYAHRLAWLYMTGEWPPCGIDHRDNCRRNNRWANLRLATQSQNCANAPVRTINKASLKGVCWHPRGRKWTARITKDGTQHYLGLFATPEAAHAAYAIAARRLFAGFAQP